MPSDTVAFPEGTVTVLSSDLVGSTLLNQRLGDTAATAVERELAALAQEQVDRQRGVVLKDTGDGHVLPHWVVHCWSRRTVGENHLRLVVVPEHDPVEQPPSWAFRLVL